MHARAIVLLIALAVTIPLGVAAQDAAQDIAREDIEMVLKGMIGESIDRQLKVADIGAGNVAVGILHRTGDHDTDGEQRGIIHTSISEVYVMLSGWGTLLTTTDIANMTEPSAGGDVVGPTASGQARSGTSREILEGDVVIIPSGTLHAWTNIPDHVTYLSIRPDPHSSLPAGYVRPGIN